MPTIPYFGLYLRDALFLDEGNKDYITRENEKYVNFEKIRMKSAMVREIRRFQSCGYPFDPHLTVQNYVYNLNALDENTLYKLSLNIEPRTREL